MTDSNDSAYPMIAGELSRLGSSLGLTKREYFAGLALQGLLAMAAPLSGDRNPSPETYARYSLKAADALIEELNKS